MVIAAESKYGRHPKMYGGHATATGENVAARHFCFALFYDLPAPAAIPTDAVDECGDHVDAAGWLGSCEGKVKHKWRWHRFDESPWSSWTRTVPAFDDRSADQSGLPDRSASPLHPVHMQYCINAVCRWATSRRDCNINFNTIYKRSDPRSVARSRELAASSQDAH